MNESTVQFNIREEPADEMRQILRLVYDALAEKGYNPISQIVGYILSEDPTYITTHGNARSLVRRIDRDELLQALVKEYLRKEETD
ncbi:MAG: IreB family regulatory phosphoprotein [Oscillospiraceae bacterium]|nr:IreB family regulatory phosphoprotein [Oscillospiraceae bacterium]